MHRFPDGTYIYNEGDERIWLEPLPGPGQGVSITHLEGDKAIGCFMINWVPEFSDDMGGGFSYSVSGAHVMTLVTQFGTMTQYMPGTLTYFDTNPPEE